MAKRQCSNWKASIHADNFVQSTSHRQNQRDFHIDLRERLLGSENNISSESQRKKKLHYFFTKTQKNQSCCPWSISQVLLIIHSAVFSLAIVPYSLAAAQLRNPCQIQ